MSIEQLFQPTDGFVSRHLGPDDAETRAMCATIGVRDLDQLIGQTVPRGIRMTQALRLDGPRGEFETLAELRRIAGKNRVLRSLIGLGYSDTIVPPVIQRNIFENPGWYTQYTPYQAEIAQGRLEALINFQTMICDLTGLPIANASLLDEATAAAEAMHMFHAARKDESHTAFFVARDCHPQTIAVVRTRAHPLEIPVVVGDPREIDLARGKYFGVVLQYPTTDGRIEDYEDLIRRAHEHGALVCVATDLLALALLRPPGEFGADAAVGSSQRFGVPLGYGGPHAAFMACRDEFKRLLPGRLVGVSRDAAGAPAYRLAIQTREQHIRREKATSNICTAQVLLAVMAGMYAVYHGPAGIRRIAERVHGLTAVLAEGLRRLGMEVGNQPFFDTIRVRSPKCEAEKLHASAVARGYNLRRCADGALGISLDEVSTPEEVQAVWEIFAGHANLPFDVRDVAESTDLKYDAKLRRTSAYLSHPVFNRFHCEHEMLRYIRKLEARDLSLTSSMIPLGSCTMKLNAAAEMYPVSWPEFAKLHPFAPREQAAGYAEMCVLLENWLAEITGFAAVSLQPNAGSQGEYAGLLAIRGYHESRGDSKRDVCLIPVSAHGTNPASAVMAGFRVVAVKCDAKGNVDIADLKARAAEHAADLAALMITYPSTHGVFEEGVKEICQIVHQYGGQVYMDGANMNAQVGLTRPGDIGADVCHLNLHKTFCIPHGGGGPGMGPIAVARHLAPFLPGDPGENAECGMQNAEKAGDCGSDCSCSGMGGGSNQKSKTQSSKSAVGPVSAAPFGSASILPISWMYIRMMGGTGLTLATQTAILNANYMAKRLSEHYPIVYSGANGRVAHEFILDCRALDESAGVKVEDIAKRLMDYGFHAPTMSWPVAGTLMIEPTESESRAELDRLCDALIAIRQEIREIEQGKLDRADNPLKHAPHTAAAVTAAEWKHGYSRERAAFPAAWVREHKFWPAVARIDNVYGDRNLFCTCVPMEERA